ncbi:family 78 glycoside hydrolase catalytic domain [Paenibacillus filicis]|uniref:alpha-L-rhamnosidase n=1 Tax=Paenibacillus gyeongsangnamensis TaxID=3388067 RepID=A0ABT4QKC2_9BACL|nr:family 78 glycoside hydrolase catalytic domain [Paenibacillus filicis]MCZ8517161.1 family 78 glycoside hydrolase catalytic domain [Paenibacillus filicis]
MLAEVWVDGELMAGTDSGWKYTETAYYGRSMAVGYETQFLEELDARLSPGDWMRPDYDDSEWKPAVVKEADDHRPVLQLTPPVSVYEVRPVRIDRLSEGRYLADFGGEVTGQFLMEAQGEAGQQVKVRCGEELLEGEAGVRFHMRCNCTYSETWTLSGRRDRLTPFDYKAFRYVEVLGPESVLQPDSFAAIVRHYPLDEEACTFESEHPLLNRVWDICKNGVKWGSQESFVDCPSREKGQYLGDNTVITHAHMYVSGDLRMTRKALTDFAHSSEAVCLGLLAVVPGSFMQEIADFSLQWPLQLLQYYRQSGDADFVREMLPVAEGICEYFAGYAREDGLLHNVNEKWNLVDWPDNLRDGYDFALTDPVGEGCHNVINAFYYGCLSAVDELRNAMGLEAAYKGRRVRLKEAYVKAFFRPEAGVFADSESSEHASLHANALPLYFGLVPAEAVLPVIRLLKSKRLACGVYMAYFLLNGLACVGELAYVFELLTSDDKRS